MSDPASLAHDEIMSLLERRAAALAKPPPEEKTGEAFDVLVVRIGGERYGIGIDHIVEVRPLDSLTHVAGLPPVWAGLVSLRGVLRAVVDGATYLGLEKDGSEEEGSHVIVISSGVLVVGLLVDEVAGFRSVRLQDIEPPLGDQGQSHRKAVSGVTADLLQLLDAGTLLADQVLVVEDGS